MDFFRHEYHGVADAALRGGHEIGINGPIDVVTAWRVGFPTLRRHQRRRIECVEVAGTVDGDIHGQWISHGEFVRCGGGADAEIADGTAEVRWFAFGGQWQHLDLHVLAFDHLLAWFGTTHEHAKG